MKLGKVIGSVWAVRKVPELKGCRLMVIQPVHSSGKDAGTAIVAADPSMLSGVGDRVIYVTSTDAAQSFCDCAAPVNAAIVELVDSVV